MVFNGVCRAGAPRLRPPFFPGGTRLVHGPWVLRSRHVEGRLKGRPCMPRLVLLRHGESVWNRDNRFSGWTDVDLSDRGVEEAKRAAALLKAQEIRFDRCFTSVLKRAIHTLWIVIDALDQA